MNINYDSYSIDDFVKSKNNEKFLFTAGPASLVSENLTGLRPCFGRGDNDYLLLEENVLLQLKNITGHQNIVRMQGSASLALEIMSNNFLFGKVLILSTGYYSDRLFRLAQSAKKIIKEISVIDYVDWNEVDNISESYDWIISCYTETSIGIKLDINFLRNLADRLNASLMLDATASIGLEEKHEYADVIGFSSCKGLFGLTGASFISYNKEPNVEVDSFYLSLLTHKEKRITGPYHSICSLAYVLPKHEEFKYAVKINKERFLHDHAKYISQKNDLQPLLCTHTKLELINDDPNIILYRPRLTQSGSVICHLGEIHLGENAKGDIIKLLKFQYEGSEL